MFVGLSVHSKKKQYNSHIKMYYNSFCKILSKVIKEAIRLYYDNQIKNSMYKNKTACNTINKYT